MSSKKRKVNSLLNRFEFIDLATAVSQPQSNRKEWLRKYLNRSLAKKGRFKTYKPFRNAIPTIYGVTRELDPSPPVSRKHLEIYVEKACKGTDVDMNVEAALTLYDLIAPEKYTAYDHEPRDLPLGLQKRASIGINTYLVQDDTVIFQFANPRRVRLKPDVLILIMSMIQHTYAVGDFENAVISIADLSTKGAGSTSKERMPSVRAPIIRYLDRADLISMDDMAPIIQDVHDLLIEIGNEVEVEP